MSAVYAYTPGNDNYVAASSSKSCSISTKALDPSKFTTGSTSKTYDGTNSSSITLTANTTSGLISGDSVTVSYTSATYNATTVATLNDISDLYRFLDRIGVDYRNLCPAKNTLLVGGEGDCIITSDLTFGWTSEEYKRKFFDLRHSGISDEEDDI